MFCRSFSFLYINLRLYIHYCLQTSGNAPIVSLEKIIFFTLQQQSHFKLSMNYEDLSIFFFFSLFDEIKCDLKSSCLFFFVFRFRIIVKAIHEMSGHKTLLFVERKKEIN